MNQPPSDRTPLRVAMLVPPWYEVPPPGYGGLEQVVAGLADALVDRGHAVTLFGAGLDSGTRADFVSTVGELQHERLGEAYPELAHLARVNRLLAAGEFDVVHDHTTIGPLLAGRRPVPTVATVHGNPVGEYGDILREVEPQVGLVAISHAQRNLAPDLHWAGTVHNGMDFTGLPRKSVASTGPVLWLARFSADKGPELAIAACREAGLPLVLAGKCYEPAERRYFAEVVEPLLGPDVRLLLNADRETCLELLREARCLIMPIRWEEPFGMVMVEAMATGTPVVALPRGAVPEVVQPGVTGMVCAHLAELPGALHEVTSLDPADCAEYARHRFSSERMAIGYEPIYARLAARADSRAVREAVPLGLR